MNKLTFTTLLITFVLSPLAYADNWQPLTGADALQSLVSGATSEIELSPGETVVGRYYADGTAEIEAWGETFNRTWVVKGDDQVCYTDLETNCFTFEQMIRPNTGPAMWQTLKYSRSGSRTLKLTHLPGKLLQAAKADLARLPPRRSPQRCLIRTPTWAA